MSSSEGKEYSVDDFLKIRRHWFFAVEVNAVSIENLLCLANRAPCLGHRLAFLSRCWGLRGLIHDEVVRGWKVLCVLGDVFASIVERGEVRVSELEWTDEVILVLER